MVFASFLIIVLACGSWMSLEHDLKEHPTALIQWERVGLPNPSSTLKLVFALKQRNLDTLLDTFHAVSDPRNVKYGQHLSLGQVNRLVAPKRSARNAVVAWLVENGLHPEFPSSDFIVATATIKQAETMLNCKYEVFKHKQTHNKNTRTMSYSVPEQIAKHLDFVTPTVQFSSLKLRVHTRPQAPLISPSTLRQLYEVGVVVGQAPSNKMAVTGFLRQHYKADDQAEFYREYYNPGEGTKITEKGNSQGGLRAGIEAMLDTEYVTVTGTNITAEFWGYDGHAPDNRKNEPFLDWLLDVGNTSDSDVPKLFSTSYGEDEDSESIPYTDRINVEFQKAGVRGISIIFASGDSGAAGDSGSCKRGKYVPQWPAASPYVTSVGATTEGSGSSREAVDFSSGGFSNRYPRQSWQESAVEAYLSNSQCPPTRYFNSSGRGFPDISAAGTGFAVVANHVMLPGVSGTSCASPTAAGVFALLNDFLIQNGKPTLGFLNPLIYQNMNLFNDITSGKNGGCSFDDGFPAVKGWDPVTGVGTPNYKNLASKLAEVVLSRPEL